MNVAVEADGKVRVSPLPLAGRYEAGGAPLDMTDFAPEMKRYLIVRVDEAESAFLLAMGPPTELTLQYPETYEVGDAHAYDFEHYLAELRKAGSYKALPAGRWSGETGSLLRSDAKGREDGVDWTGSRFSLEMGEENGRPVRVARQGRQGQHEGYFTVVSATNERVRLHVSTTYFPFRSGQN